MTKRKNIYSGVLNEPMKVHSARQSLLGDGPTAAKQAEHTAKNLEQYWVRVKALFEHYNVDLSDPMTLALKLAKIHVPGFSYAWSSPHELVHPYS